MISNITYAFYLRSTCLDALSICYPPQNDRTKVQNSRKLHQLGKTARNTYTSNVELQSSPRLCSWIVLNFAVTRLEFFTFTFLIIVNLHLLYFCCAILTYPSVDDPTGFGIGHIFYPAVNDTTAKSNV